MSPESSKRVPQCESPASNQAVQQGQGIFMSFYSRAIVDVVVDAFVAGIQSVSGTQVMTQQSWVMNELSLKSITSPTKKI